MFDFLFQLDKLKNKFLDNSTDADILLDIRVQLDEPEEITVDPIEKLLINALKRIAFKQKLENSKHVTDA